MAFKCTFKRRKSSTPNATRTDFPIAMAMESSSPSEVEYLQTTNVPFSWEAKPGVPKLHSHDPNPSSSLLESSILKLPSPPCLSESARFSGDYGAAISYSPRGRGESGRINKDDLWLEASSDAASFRCCKWDGLKERDPFVEAYKKCTKGPSMSCRPMSGGSATNDVKRRSIRRRVLFSLSRFWC